VVQRRQLGKEERIVIRVEKVVALFKHGDEHDIKGRSGKENEKRQRSVEAVSGKYFSHLIFSQ
jgi:hypothetical protein